MSIANKLVNEQSPYLLQHAYNPVDWYPWSEEAFEKARIENKPIFLSIGYSTFTVVLARRPSSRLPIIIPFSFGGGSAVTIPRPWK